MFKSALDEEVKKIKNNDMCLWSLCAATAVCVSSQTHFQPRSMINTEAFHIIDYTIIEMLNLWHTFMKELLLVKQPVKMERKKELPLHLVFFSLSHFFRPGA